MPCKAVLTPASFSALIAKREKRRTCDHARVAAFDHASELGRCHEIPSFALVYVGRFAQALVILRVAVKSPSAIVSSVAVAISW